MYKIKIYVKEKKEVIELIDSKSKRVIYSYSGELGKLFADFIHSNTDDAHTYLDQLVWIFRKNKDDRDISLKKAMEAFPKIHIFFYMYSIVLNRISEEGLSSGESREVTQTLSHPFYTVSKLQEFLTDIIERCLNVKVVESKKISEKYEKILSEYKEHSGYEICPAISNIYYEYFPEREFNYNMFSNKKSEFCSVIYPQTIEDIIYFLLKEVLKKRVKYKKCKNCDRYYVVSGKKNSEYCSRPIDGTGKTCKDVGSVKSYLRKRKEDPIRSAYTKAYNTKNARIRYGIITREEFHEWAEKARAKRKDCEEGRITLEDFEFWLNKKIKFIEI